MTACTAPRHDSDPQPPEAAPSARLCAACTTRLAADIAKLPPLYAQLAEMLVPSGAGDGDGDGLPFNAAASGCRDQILHDLAWWTGRVARERRWLLPDPLSVPALAGWLHPQARWASFRNWAGDMAGAMADDRHRAGMLLNPPPAGRIIIPDDLNWCPRCQGTGCLRILYAGAWERRPVAVSCMCGYVWDAGQQLQTLGWMILRRRDTAGAV